MKNTLKNLIFAGSPNGKPRLLKQAEIPSGVTKRELVEAYGIEFTFDFAIPNDWACIAQGLGKESAGWWNVVWSYDEKSGGWGRPFPLTVEALEAIRWTNRKLGWLAPKDEDFDFFHIEIEANEYQRQYN